MKANLVAIKDCVVKAKTWNPVVEAKDETITYIDIAAVDKDLKKIVEPTLCLGAEAPSRARQLVQTNDVLVSTVRPNLNSVAVVTEEFSGATASTGYTVLRPLPEVLDTQYLFHWVKTGHFINEMIKLATGQSYPAVSDKIILNSKIPLPPLAEQRRIASILDQADVLRQKRQQAIEKLDQLLQATFIDVFGDPVSNPKGWEAKPIDNICANIVDCVNKTAPIVEYETPYKMIRTTNVRNHKVDISSVRYVEKETFDKWNRRLTPKRGDVILTREAPVGEVGILESDDSVFLGQRLMLYRVNLELTTPEYLLYFLMSDNLKMQYEQMSSGSTVKHLSVPQCSKWSIYLPPIVLQLKFSEFYKMIHANLELMRISYNKADTLFKSLQNQAFSGTL
ncbi:restriction endonuclease subunit S [Acinetobacter johnsonii]|uniref:restriction endonuclease subunit S n=1 Tax=Acinetobacter johnsonii TaxID=40214 RepID=UPI001F41D3D0|nr:restriction endonuclease subunit S [Acinetobacter johnsonii]UIP96685.1 restriction endonuclease subunit S [Acinetobacter johnsonii]